MPKNEKDRAKQPKEKPPSDGYIATLYALAHAGPHTAEKRRIQEKLSAARISSKGSGAAADVDLSELEADPELQQAYAAILEYTPGKWLLEQEAKLIADRRDVHATTPTDRFRAQDPNEDIYTWAQENQLTGLCFSGGGIRSATFNLGILQGLAAKGCLPQFDYLSSVSGGGYIHSWLAGWLQRETTAKKKVGDPKPEFSAWQQVMSQIRPLPSEANGPPSHVVWPPQIQWLRKYSNYLTPRKGALAGDTWASVATWLRNVLLNQALLLLMFLAVLCLPHLLSPTTHLVPLRPATVEKSATVSTVKIDQVATTLSLQLTTTPAEQSNAAAETNNFGPRFAAYLPTGSLRADLEALETAPRLISLAMLALASYGIGCTCIGWLLRLEYGGTKRGTDENALPARRGDTRKAGVRRREFMIVCFGVVAPLLLFGIVLADIVRTHPESSAWTIKVFCLLLGLVWTETLCGGALGNTVGQEQDRRKAASPDPEKVKRPGVFWQTVVTLGLLALGLPAAAAGTLLAAAIAALLQSAWMGNIQHWLLLSEPCSLQMTVGTLLFFWLPPLTMVVASGLIGKNFPEWLGEWLARIRGYTLVVGICWICLCGCALLLPGVAVRAFSVHWVGWTGLSTWALSTLTGVISGKSGKTTGDQHASSGPLEWAAVVAPYLYIFGLAVLLSWLLAWAQGQGWPAGEMGWATAIVVLSALAALLGWRLDINQFSMNSFYRNRLTRCYLGASNLKRNPSPVTGFDEHDSSDLCIHRLTPAEYPGPIPIFCCAMNITMGEDLAWQERKAASFAFTPLYSGYNVGWTEWRKNLSFNGFVPTRLLYPGGPNVATAMAASGAAISPNWGYHTKPATAFLLTMFDARLGLWVPNPRRSPAAGRSSATASVPPGSPRFAPFWLISELLGSVNDTSKYVYVTDGGHFDNMGLYELVRRRCYRILICDAEEDGTYVYEGIGAAIRKCRIDFGAEIKLDLSDLSPNVKNQLSPVHILRGSIRYPETPAGKEYVGTVTYIKASLTGKVPPPGAAAPVKGAVELPNVPADVQNYKLQHQDFPHDSTAEQWFTESQFESYRRLGQSIADGLKTLF